MATQIKSGGTIPTSGDVELERGGTYNVGRALGGGSSPLRIAPYGDASAPLPLLLCSSSWCFDWSNRNDVRGLQLKAAQPGRNGFEFHAGGILQDILFVGGDWGDAAIARAGTTQLDVLNFDGDSVIGRHWFYDDSKGHASDIVFDGFMWPGSRGENCARVKSAQRVTFKNGSIYAPRNTEGDKLQKAYITIQGEPNTSGPRWITLYRIKARGPAGISPIKTESGWQNAPVRDVTFRQVSSDAAHDISIGNGVERILIEDCGGAFGVYNCPNRPVIIFNFNNPNFPKQASITIRNFHSIGWPKFSDGNAAGKIFGENVTHNGKPVQLDGAAEPGDPDPNDGGATPGEVTMPKVTSVKIYDASNINNVLAVATSNGQTIEIDPAKLPAAGFLNAQAMFDVAPVSARVSLDDGQTWRNEGGAITFASAPGFRLLPGKPVKLAVQSTGPGTAGETFKVTLQLATTAPGPVDPGTGDAATIVDLQRQLQAAQATIGELRAYVAAVRNLIDKLPAQPV